MDPLSVAASIAGLLTVTVQVSKVLSDVVSKTKHAPEECRKIQNEVDDIRGVLAQLQLFVTGVNRASRSRTSLIMVEQVIVTLAACVTTFSELDLLVTKLHSEATMDVLDRLRWISKDKEIKGVLYRLESHKSSLTLMLIILTCQKQDDAEEKVDKLCQLVKTTLEQHVILRERLTAAETGELKRQATIYEPIARQSSTSNDFSGLNVTSWEDIPGSNDEAPNWQRSSRGFAFEELLYSSRAYKNAGRDKGSDAFSIFSSAGRTASWSIMSGLSLSEISHLAFFAIPIYATDINNNSAYEFEIPIEEAGQSPIQEPTSVVRQEAKAKGSRMQWLKNLFRPSLSEHYEETPESESPHIFGASLSRSIEYSNIAIGMMGQNGRPYIYGYIPYIVGRLAVLLKERAINTEDIFARNGNPTRMMELQLVFDNPTPLGFDWDGYTVHDAAGILLRYLKSLPEPVIPYKSYPKIMTVLGPKVHNMLEGRHSNARADTLKSAQELLSGLPQVHYRMLLYLLDLLAVFAAKKDSNKMSVERLVSVFQPSILSGPPASMDADAHLGAASVTVFLVQSSDGLTIQANFKDDAAAGKEALSRRKRRVGNTG